MGTKYEFAFLYLEPDYFMLFLDLKACCQFILDFKKNIIFQFQMKVPSTYILFTLSKYNFCARYFTLITISFKTKNLKVCHLRKSKMFMYERM